jgi:hypothetical protein
MVQCSEDVAATESPFLLPAVYVHSAAEPALYSTVRVRLAILPWPKQNSLPSGSGTTVQLATAIPVRPIAVRPCGDGDASRPG